MAHRRSGHVFRLRPGTRLALGLPLLALAALFCFQACGSGNSEAPVPQESQDEHASISWYEGDVADAFALAENQGSPLFLYWGAEWCPPCYYLKDKLFTRPEFIARMEDFVPVYLDGDTERAQIWGEELGIRGYPTVIVFSAAGDEIMRMPSTLPVDQYEAVLDAAMESTRPVKAVLEAVMAGGVSSAAPADLATLAFYSWEQDSTVGLEAPERLAIFRRLYDESPPELEVERSRFLTHYLVTAIEVHRQSSGSSEAAPIPADEIEDLRQEAMRILGAQELRSANLTWVRYFSADTVELLTPDPGQERTELMRAWQSAAAEIESDPSLSVDDRLSALLPQIALARLADEPASADADGEPWEATEELEQQVRERVTWASNEVTDEGELQATMNTMAYLLSSVGLEDEAEALLAARMNDTVAPYYFMSWMGSIKEDDGKIDEALVWYRKAYESSRGRYSRFRWGSMYLRHLLELAPDDTQTIQEHSTEILEELLALEDAFAGGNYSRLEGLEMGYQDWNESGEHSATLAELRDFVHDACARFPAEGEDSQRSRCSSFLVNESEPASEPV